MTKKPYISVSKILTPMKSTATLLIIIGCIATSGLVIAQNNRFSEKPRKETAQPLPPSLQNIPEIDGSRTSKNLAMKTLTQ